MAVCASLPVLPSTAREPRVFRCERIACRLDIGGDVLLQVEAHRDFAGFATLFLEASAGVLVADRAVEELLRREDGGLAGTADDVRQRQCG
jgi:hypothetical protein